MKNPHLARLDRQIRLHGEEVQLIHTVGSSTQTNTRAQIRGIVKTLGIEQIIAGITATNYMVIISPTDLRRAAWPGAVAVAAASGIPISARDAVVPTTADKITFRGAQKAISKVDAIYDGDECVRIELTCVGG
jgi:hypothetical protein